MTAHTITSVDYVVKAITVLDDKGTDVPAFAINKVFHFGERTSKEHRVYIICTDTLATQTHLMQAIFQAFHLAQIKAQLMASHSQYSSAVLYDCPGFASFTQRAVM